MDVSGPLDVFAEANVQARREEYRLLIVASTAGEIRSSSGTRLMPENRALRGDAAHKELLELLADMGAPKKA